MIYNQILVRFGDLTLKGKNQKVFLKTLYKLMDEKMEGLNVYVERTHDRIFIHLNDEDVNKVIERLNLVSGISSYSLVVKCSDDLNDIKETALKLMQEVVKKKTTFKVNTKRADKNYPMHSLEITKHVSGYVLSHNNDLVVDVHNPEVELNLEIRGGACYLFNTNIRAMGGFPVGVAGKGLLMLSGGIDSPVAGYMAMKRGIKLECIYFESPPHTSPQAKEKVKKLVSILNNYQAGIKLHIINFTEIQEAIYRNILPEYMITIMRRMMYRISEKVMHERNSLVLINGESVGQVASQTLTSMSVINSVTNVPVIRPVACLDKLEIIDIAKKINTYETSILPYEDCCTIFLPKHPVINPKLDMAINYENLFNYEDMINRAVSNRQIINIELNQKKFDI